MTGANFGVLLGAFVTVAVVWVQGLIASRTQKQQFDLERNKVFWDFDLEAYKELETLLAFFIEDAGLRFKPEEMGSELLRDHQQKRSEYLRLLRKHQMRFPEIDRFLLMWSRVMYGRVGIRISVGREEGSGTSYESLSQEEKSNLTELNKEARRILQSVRSDFLNSGTSVKGLSVAPLDRLVKLSQPIRDYIMGRSREK